MQQYRKCIKRTYRYDSMRSTMSLNMKRSDDIASTRRTMIASDSSD